MRPASGRSPGDAFVAGLGSNPNRGVLQKIFYALWRGVRRPFWGHPAGEPPPGAHPPVQVTLQGFRKAAADFGFIS